ncbi:type VI secretion system ImpA family N-terminal domain-containing protein [Neisseriaceae bacterium TC5R-5]|nr:type VI secretion system ImpA family N-terminal domain-containing protein [Neisseriaceae bacterium TC5R-5]
MLIQGKIMPTNHLGAQIKYSELLEAISTEAPCGLNLEYDPAFVMLQSSIAAKMDAQYGDFVGLAEPVNWAEVERDSRTLLLRTKDIRLVIILLRSRLRQVGAEGLRDGVVLLKSLLDIYPDYLHPALVIDGEYDPIMRANAFTELVDHSGLLLDVRNINLPKAAGLQLQVKDVEKAFAIPRVKDALTGEAVLRVLKELKAKRDKTVVALTEAYAELLALSNTLQTEMTADAPDLQELVKLLQPFASEEVESTVAIAHSSDMVERVEHDLTSSPVTMPVEGNEFVAVNHAPETVGVTIEKSSVVISSSMDRWAALGKIQQIRTWFEDNEPSSPVIILLRQAERMVGKRYSELIDMVPLEVLAKWDQSGDE